MLRHSLALVIFALCVGFSGLGASAQGHGPGGPRYAPPPARYERRGPSPGSGYVWVGGYHHWNGHSYVWIGGRYQRPPHYGYRWYPGYYNNRGGVYIWIGGHWGPP